MTKALKISLLSFFISHSIFSSEGDLYDFSWLDPDKEVYVLQNRRYRKSGSPYINVGGGITTSGAFVDGTNLQARAGFFFKEEWGIEGVYSKNSGKENDTAESVRNIGTTITPYRKIVNGYQGAMLMWSPFYSKINTFNQIFYLDWMFGLGYGSVEETNNEQEYSSNGEDKTKKTETASGFIWQTSLKIYISERWDVRFNLITMNYKSEIPTGTAKTQSEDWSHHYDLSLSLGLTF